MNKTKISKVLMAAALGAAAVVGGSLVERHDAQAQNATSGSLRGTIRDKVDDKAAVGSRTPLIDCEACWP